jgi:hypothetical protein
MQGNTTPLKWWLEKLKCNINEDGYVKSLREKVQLQILLGF